MITTRSRKPPTRTGTAAAGVLSMRCPKSRGRHFSPDKRQHGFHNPEGTALVIHAGRDDYKSDPSGGGGDRIACGEIRG
jgi:Cu/Zn superoxide dismutase